MNKKYTRIILLCAVALVWGIVIFQIKNYFTQNDPINNTNKGIPIADNKTDSISIFNLLFNYQDPFLDRKLTPSKEVSNTVSIVHHSPVIVKNTESNPQTKTEMPAIKYFGSISNSETKKLVAIVNIAGKQCIAKQGDLIDNISILKVEHDSILIAYEKSKKWIHK